MSSACPPRTLQRCRNSCRTISYTVGIRRVPVLTSKRPSRLGSLQAPSPGSLERHGLTAAMATAAAAAATTTTTTTTTAKTTRRDSRRDGDGRTDPHGRAAPRRSPAPHRAPHRAPHVPSRRRSAVVSRRRVSPSSRRRLAVAVAVAAPRAASNMPFLPRSQTPIASNPFAAADS